MSSSVSSNAKWSCSGEFAVWLPAGHPSGIAVSGAVDVYAYVQYNNNTVLTSAAGILYSAIVRD